MGDSDKLLVFGAAYADSGEALADYYEIRELYGNGEIGVYDAAVMTREPSGEVIVANADSAGRGRSPARALSSVQSSAWCSHRRSWGLPLWAPPRVRRLVASVAI